MNTNELNRAREYERKQGAAVRPKERAAFHLTPLTGWMNDPNGFSRYQGKYHLFYQYYPYETNWGPMHWGHAVTEDFVRWEYLPAALAPDSEFDSFGCWSGSAIETRDGKHALIYTGVTEHSEDGREREIRQLQCLAIGDGIDYEKLEGNPVIGSELLPEEASVSDFRDPKVWYDKNDDCYYSIVGNRSSDGSGMLMLFRSEDLRHWSFVTIVDRSSNRYGKMWECPDCFSLDGRDVIILSPQEMRADGYEFHYGNNTLCLIGKMDPKTHKFTRETARSIDQGLDFYAPTTVETPDGRRIMIGWMQSWESCRNQPAGNHFFGTMSLPRELSVKDGILLQAPVRELERYRKNPVEYRAQAVDGDLCLAGIEGRLIDMTVEIDAETASSEDLFTIRFAEDEENHCLIRYAAEKGILGFDRGECGFNCDIVNVREICTTQKRVKLRIILDRYSAEIFVNDGERVLTSTFYTPSEAKKITFSSTERALINVSKWDIEIPQQSF